MSTPAQEIRQPVRSAFGLARLTDYRPDSPFVVFYGESSESHETVLKGKLTLTNPESISVRSVRITLTGTRKVSYAPPFAHIATSAG
jgi:hypothetical protein